MTNEQRDKILEWCGFKQITNERKAGYETREWLSPDLKYQYVLPPTIDLNFFGKWVFPKLQRENKFHYMHFGFDRTDANIKTIQITFANKLLADGEGLSYEDALISALLKLIEEDEKK
jgi:hypothetical protein